MKPSVTRYGKASAQCSYELPHRVHSVAIYPHKASNGSSIIIYGHETGLRILWRGGRRPRSPIAPNKPKPSNAKVNGTATAAIVLDSSDDEQPQLEENNVDAGYESEEEELDQDNPYPSIVRHVDLSINSEVLHVCTPHLPPVDSPGTSNRIPEALTKKAIFSAVCGDGSLRVISLPLDPPPLSRKPVKKSAASSGHYGEEIRTIGSQYGHRNIAHDIALTFTPRSTAVDLAEDVDMPDLDPRSPRHQNGTKPQEWDLLLASTSVDPVGNLRLYNMPLASDGGVTTISTGPPYVQQYKSLPFTPLTISFSPNTYPNSHHSELLVAGSQGILKIYDPLAPPRNRRRLLRLEDDETDAFALQGSWLSSFGVEFEYTKQSDPDAPSTAQRKTILDAQWATSGRSVVVLLADGEWGLWDVEGSGPSGTGQASTKINQNSGFAIRGFVGIAQTASSSVGSKSRPSRSLAPMTPNTRRVREENLFQPSTQSQTIAHGNISVASLVSTSGGASEDTVLIRYGSDIHRISNLAQYWSRVGSGSTGSLYSSGIVKVEGLDTQGEMINAIAQFDLTHSEARMAVPRDFLVLAEHRLLVLAHSMSTAKSRGKLFYDKDKAQQDRAAVQEMEIDQTLLAKGELDLNGMDRLLDNMEGSGKPFAASTRHVGFAAS